MEKNPHWELRILLDSFRLVTNKIFLDYFSLIFMYTVEHGNKERSDRPKIVP